jgi:hypothetical protein
MNGSKIFTMGSLLFLGIAGPTAAYAHPWGPGGWCGCPWHDHGYRPYRGNDPSYGYNANVPHYARPSEPISLDKAKGVFEAYLRSTNNPNLKLGKIKEQKEGFIAQITTKDGSLVDEIALDRYSGYMGSVYE